MQEGTSDKLELLKSRNQKMCIKISAKDNRYHLIELPLQNNYLYWTPENENDGALNVEVECHQNCLESLSVKFVSWSWKKCKEPSGFSAKDELITLVHLKNSKLSSYVLRES